jgi:hypothetical protein
VEALCSAGAGLGLLRLGFGLCGGAELGAAERANAVLTTTDCCDKLIAYLFAMLLPPLGFLGFVGKTRQFDLRDHKIHQRISVYTLESGVRFQVAKAM